MTSNNTLIIKSLYPKINYGLFLSMVSKSPYLLYSFQDYMLLFNTTTEFINLEIFYSKLNYIKNYTFLKKVICYICIVYILSEVKVLKIKNIYRNYNKEIKHLTGTINLQMKFFQYSFSIDIILYLNRLYSGSLFIDITYVKL